MASRKRGHSATKDDKEEGSHRASSQQRSSSGLLGLHGPIVEAMKSHSSKLDDEINTIINEVFPKRIAELQEEIKREGEGSTLSLAEKQANASRLSVELTRSMDTVAHWIALQQEKLECGNEFGSEVQATVSSCLTRSASGVADRKDYMTSLLLDQLNLDIPKFVILNQTEVHKTIKETLQLDYTRSYTRFLSEVQRTYLRCLQVLYNNRSALIDPKNKKGLRSSGSADDRAGSFFV